MDAAAGRQQADRYKPSLPSLKSQSTFNAGELPENSGESSPSKKNKQKRDSSGKPRRHPLVELLSNGVYVNTVLSLSCLFFVVTGV